MDVSVIVPFYKGNTHMAQLFGCISRNAQAAPNLSIELVLINDSPGVVIEYDKAWIQDFSLQILENPENAGIQQARVNGLAAAHGQRIIFLDQDDLLADDAILSQYHALGDADIVLANGYKENNNSREPIYRTLSQQQLAATPRFYYTVGNQIVSPGQCMIRRDVIPQLWCQGCIGRNGSDDLLLWMLLFHQQAHWAVNPQHLYTHMDTGHNLSNNIQKMVESSWEVLDVLQQHHLINKKHTRQFRRGRLMAGAYIGKPASQKILAMLCYPDIAWQRFLLKVKSRKS